MQTFRLIAKHELRQIFREPQFFLPYLLVPFLMLAIYGLIITAQPPETGEGAFITRLLVLSIGAIMSGMSLALCADSFAGEKERRTLETLFCTPISLRAIFLGKLGGILIVPVVAGWVGQILVITLGAVKGYSLLSGPLLICAFLLTPVTGLLISSIAVAFSLRLATVRSAAQMSGLFLLGLLFSIQGLTQWFFSSTGRAVLLLSAFFLLSMAIISRNMIKFERILFK